MKQQLLQGKVPSGLPPNVAAIAASLSPDQIRNTAAALLRVPSPPSGGDQLARPAGPQTQYQQNLQMQEEAKEAAMAALRQNREPNVQDIADRPQAQESQVRPSVFRQMFRPPQFLRHLRRPAPPPVPSESVFEDETLSVFESENGPSVHLPPPDQDGDQMLQDAAPPQQERPNIQIIPLDGRPNGSPHLDQVEQMLSAALYHQHARPQYEQVLVRSPPRNQVTYLTRDPIRQQAPIHLAQVRRPVGPPAGPQYTPSNLQRKPLFLSGARQQQLTRPPPLMPLIPRHQPPVLSQSFRQVSPPKFQSTYSNGWIPKDLPHDWSPGQGPIRSPAEYAVFQFTATDSITPNPRTAVTRVPPQQLAPLLPVTTTTSTTTYAPPLPTTSIAATTQSPDAQPKPLPIPSSSPASSEVDEPTSPPKGKQELIKLWLSQTEPSGEVVSPPTSPPSPYHVVKKATFGTRRPLGPGSRKPRVKHVPKDDKDKPIHVPFPSTTSPNNNNKRTPVITSANPSTTSSTTTSSTTTTTSTTTAVPQTAGPTESPSTTRKSLAEKASEFSSQREVRVEPVPPVRDETVGVEALDVSQSAPPEKIASRYMEGIIRNEAKVSFGSKRHSFDRIQTTSVPTTTTHHSDPLSLSESRHQHLTGHTLSPPATDPSSTTTPGPIYVSSPPVDMISPWTTTSISVVTTAASAPPAAQSVAAEKQISRRSSSPYETLDSIEISFGERTIDKKVGLVKEGI